MGTAREGMLGSVLKGMLESVSGMLEGVREYV